MPRDLGPTASAGVAQTNAAAANSGETANSLYSMAQPAIQNQLNPNAQTRASLTQLPMQAANSAFGAAQQNAAQRVAKTNNSAGYSNLSDKLAMDKGKADSTAALEGQQAIQGLQNEGVKNASNLYGINQETMAKLYGIGPEWINSQANLNKSKQFSVKTPLGGFTT